MESPHSAEQHIFQHMRSEAQTALHYTRPEIFEVGRAIDLVQSYSSGKDSDGYSGHYWER